MPVEEYLPQLVGAAGVAAVAVPVAVARAWRRVRALVSGRPAGAQEAPDLDPT